ncbi:MULTISPECIES: hypothetical protein [Pseudoalteromonas]|uniref:hypothetical protein n=1 Tax=Pseudoalteromonas TaxID=53246 RepID=UPI001649A90E|nr:MULTISPECIES: hypothetical protein [Pseudoalteromonas]
MALTQQQAIEIIKEGEKDALDLLIEADPKLAHKFNRVDKSLVNLLVDVRKHFPDAQFYTASGGFNLLLGAPHNDAGMPQAELHACSGRASIADGDF